MEWKKVLKRLKDDGWYEKNQEGSHIHLIHPTKGGKITLPRNGKKDLKPGTLNAILKQAGLK